MFFMRLSAHLTIDVPAAATVLDPNVPVPFGALRVSPAISETVEGSSPSLEDRIWAKTVAWPCPESDDPLTNKTFPSGDTVTRANSECGFRSGPPAISIGFAIPKPRNYCI